MSYSEKQLLMLSNFVYLDACKKEASLKEILSEYMTSEGTFTQESVEGAGTGGGLDSNQVAQLFTQMKEECDKNGSDFGSLSAARRLEEDDVRGICYTNSEDENPVIVFRGTGGTKEAWTDNLNGGFDSNTRIQKVADDFVRYECAGYDGCSVTGHSKGGNLSQYVTVMNADKIERCISFDGQGFNADFLSENAKNIEKAAPKIKSICAHNDFVGILLTAIAGEVIYVANSGKGIEGHSSLTMLTSNKYDKDGNITTLEDQSFLSKRMKKVTDVIADVVSDMPDDDNKMIGGILGTALADAVMAHDSEEIKDCAERAASEAMLAFALKLDTLKEREDGGEDFSVADHLYIYGEGVRGVLGNLADLRLKVRSLVGMTETIKENIEMNVASKFYTENALEKVIENMNCITKKMLEYEGILESSVIRYEASEAKITGITMSLSQRYMTN